jgi:hypothetical protein
MPLVFDNFPAIIRAVPDIAADIVGKVSEDGAAATKEAIVEQHIIDTGRYLNSWEAEDTRRTPHGAEGGYGSDVEYGPFQEYGTRYMHARPHVVPVAEHMQHELSKAFGTLEARLRARGLGR